MSDAPINGVSRGCKALIHLVPRSVEEPVFEGRVREAAALLRRRGEDHRAVVNAMFRVKDDPLGRRTPFRAALEVVGEDVNLASLTALGAHVAGVLDDVVHVDLSSFLVGEDIVFIPAKGRMPVRFQYLMRRQSHLSRAKYLEHYHEVHSQIGVKTPGIEGYAQFRVDPDASRAATIAAGLGVWAVDSVSQLHLESVETFISAVSTSKVGPAAVADERTFVDRRNSFEFTSRVEWDAV